MSAQEIVDQALASLTPERLRVVVEQIAGTQLPDDRKSVNITSIMDALTGTKDLLASGAEGWGAYLKFRRALQEMAAQTQGLRYVEVDS